jgi:hypothetical protein
MLTPDAYRRRRNGLAVTHHGRDHPDDDEHPDGEPDPSAST